MKKAKWYGSRQDKVYWCKFKTANNYSYGQIAIFCNEANGTKYTGSQMRDMLKRVMKDCNVEQKIERVKISDRPTLAFGDMHYPFEHEHFNKFLQDVDKEYNCADTKVCMGDMVDNHAVSRHTNSHRSKGGMDEYHLTYEKIQEITKIFPNVLYCMGNHDAIPMRQAQSIGLTDVFVKSFSECWNLPDTWDVRPSHKVNGVKYKHGMGCGSDNGDLKSAKNDNMSTVIGHAHTKAGVRYGANEERALFGANAGCGIDVGAYAFEYQGEYVVKPVLGCLIVYNSTKALFVPMDIDYYNNKYGRSRK